jgi:hypothetical protein
VIPTHIQMGLPSQLEPCGQYSASRRPDITPATSLGKKSGTWDMLK